MRSNHTALTIAASAWPCTAGTNSAVLSAFEVSYNIALHRSTVIIIIIIIIYFYTPGSKDPRGLKTKNAKRARVLGVLKLNADGYRLQ